jgi:hypothetical protein
MIDNDIERLRTEALHLQKAALWAAERHYAAETPWYSVVPLLTVPTAILSAIGGAAAFSRLNHSEVVAGTIAIIVAVLTAISTRLNPESRAAIHHRTAKAYEALYHEAGFFYRVESLSPSFTREKLEEKLQSISTKLNAVNESAPGISGRAYRIATKKINENAGEVVGSMDNELERK